MNIIFQKFPRENVPIHSVLKIMQLIFTFIIQIDNLAMREKTFNSHLPLRIPVHLRSLQLYLAKRVAKMVHAIKCDKNIKRFNTRFFESSSSLRICF